MEKMALIIAAGGKGTRFGSKLPKQFIEIDGIPAIVRSILPFKGLVGKIVISLTDGYEAHLRSILPKDITDILTVVPGGETRYDSVKNALKVISDDFMLVAIHDAARPFVDSELILRVMQMAKEHGAAIPVVPLVDSIRRVNPDGTSEIRDRNNYAFVQTPQIFDHSLLKEAYTQPYSTLITDDASLIELMGRTVYTAVGSPKNIKITYPSDL